MEGMSYEDVNELLGTTGWKKMATGDRTVYQWFLGGYTVLRATFSGGLLTKWQRRQIPPPPPAPPPNVRQTDGKQHIRLAFIQDLLNLGVFHKAETVGQTRANLWVGPLFYLLDFEKKQSFVGVVAAYYFMENNDTLTVRLYDGLTGNKVGSYDILSGKLKMY